MCRGRIRRSDTSRRGFTLFEVLAAALVLVLVGTLLIGSMNTNLTHQSDARNRLEAGRIADSALADLEATLRDGSAPALGTDESERNGFRVRTAVTPFGTFFENDPEARAATGGDGASGGGLFEQIANEFPGLPKHMRALKVTVEWGDPMSPDSVVRSTVAFDHAAAVEALEGLAGGGDGGAS
jgi:type II secretory pathway pseudopilin PulG